MVRVIRDRYPGHGGGELRFAFSPDRADHGCKRNPCSSGRQGVWDPTSRTRGNQSGIDCGDRMVVPFGPASHPDRVRADGQTAGADPPPAIHRSAGKSSAESERIGRSADPMTRCRSRAWKRQAICPSALLSVLAWSPIVQLPDRAQRLGRSLDVRELA